MLPLDDDVAGVLSRVNCCCISASFELNTDVAEPRAL